MIGRGWILHRVRGLFLLAFFMLAVPYVFAQEEEVEAVVEDVDEAVDDDLAVDEADDDLTDVAEDAEEVDVDGEEYEAQYGRNLKAVPYAIRYAYSKSTGASWEKAGYDERVYFIRKWEQDERAAADADAAFLMQRERELSMKENQRNQEKESEQRRIDERERQRARVRQAEEQEKAEIARRIQRQKQRIEEFRSKQRR